MGKLGGDARSVIRHSSDAQSLLYFLPVGNRRAVLFKRNALD